MAVAQNGAASAGPGTATLGDIAQFLAVSQQGGFLFDDIRDLLDQHFQRLTALEKAAMYWLAINREPSAIEDLQADLLTHVPPATCGNRSTRCSGDRWSSATAIASPSSRW
ncbi:hypothetical protein IQ254_11530 [Nodosilinea sp. LEGE 07088]|uniref:hypothetical protein n=1 Tax=Nodosilinea sp. LEGE 07088 TaxID=2777968 RepID=UPI001882ACAE|nr:hypothetical protein [Nodosilinea sp. LEGE 07088]MBE9137815.1 hypothetical protein [Nodosilinea sp. LEGE 07088]